MVGKALRLLFNLYPGEGRKAYLFLVLALLWSIGSYGTFTLSEGMFLERVGSTFLPQSYFAIATLMCMLSGVLIFALSRFSISSLLFSIITAWILTISLFFLFCAQPSTFFWFLFKVIGWIIPISTYIVYWAFVDQYFDLQDGKRFFCLFNAVIFLGDSLGGAILSFFLKPLGMGGVLFLFASSMALSLPLIFYITKKITPVLEEHADTIDSKATVGGRSLIKTILNSKFTIYLLLFYFLMQLLAVVTEYNYMDVFEREFTNPNEHSVTEFMGTCGMWISLGNMFLAMLLYGRLVKKMGVNNMILIAPSLFMALFVAWISKDALPLAIMGMVAREGLSYTFDDNNLNLLISGVPPKIKYQVRISVESFIEPAGMFCAAILLLFLPAKALKLGLFLSLFCFLIVLFLRKQYPKAIFRNLVSSSIRFEKKAIDWIAGLSNKDKRETEFHLLSNLKKRDEKGQLLAYEYLLKMGNIAVLPHLLNHIGKLSLPSKLKAIELLAESPWAKENSVIERLECWRRVLPHPAIKSAIHFYFARLGLLRPERVMHDLHSEHLGLRAAAILSLKTSHHSLHLPSFYLLAQEKLIQLLHSKEEREICMGLKILGLEKNVEHIEQVFIYLKHPSLTVNREAAKALFSVSDPQKKEYAKPLISRLSFTSDPEVRHYFLCSLEKLADLESVKELILSSVHFRPSERKAIEQIVLGVGSPASEVLLEILCNTKVHDRARLLAGKILGKLDIKTLKKHLVKIVRKEIERAYFYFYHAKTVQTGMVQTSMQGHDLTILENALLTGYHSIVDFIIQLLGVAGSIIECEVLSHTLKSQNRKIRAQAIESLQKTCEAKLFTLLEPLIDERQAQEKLKLYMQKRKGLNLMELLDVLEASPSLGDQIVSIELKAKLKIPDWRKVLQGKMAGKEEIFQHFAHELLETTN